MPPKRRRLDPMHHMVGSALELGRYIPYGEEASFISGIEVAADHIQKLLSSDPARAVKLYEVLLDGLNKKAEEIDDSDGYLGTFADDLVGRWIHARQAAKADPDETAKLLLDRMDDDPYGFCNDAGKKAAEVLDRAGLQAFERQVRVRFDADGGKCWGDELRAVYAAQRDIDKYVELFRKTELTPSDCYTIATVLETKRKFADALAWAERGTKMETGERFTRAGFQLADMKRRLLKKVGRDADALNSAWAEFQKGADKFTYAELMRYVPKIERAAWHEKAMEAAEDGDLHDLIELWLEANEADRLVERLRNASHEDIEELSHYTTEPAAKYLAKSHPGVAAKVYRALGMRIINGGKSRYYSEALSSFREAKRCYEQAGQRREWEALVSEVRREHRRKSGFMPAFERLAVSQ